MNKKVSIRVRIKFDNAGFILAYVCHVYLARGELLASYISVRVTIIKNLNNFRGIGYWIVAVRSYLLCLKRLLLFQLLKNAKLIIISPLVKD